MKLVAVLWFLVVAIATAQSGNTATEMEKVAKGLQKRLADRLSKFFKKFKGKKGAKKDVSSLMRTALEKLDGPDNTELVRGWERASKSCMNNVKCKTEFDNTATYMEQAANGFLAGQAVADGLSKVLEKSVDFQKLAGNIGKLAPFLGAVGPVLTLFSLFGNSPEVERLNKLMEMVNKGFQRMETRFDQIEYQLKDLQNVVKNEHFWTRLHPYLVDLTTVQQRVVNYYKVTKPADREQRRKDLDDSYYDLTFRAIYAIAGSFEGKHREVELCDAVRDFTQIDRYEVLRVSTLLFNRMVTGAQHLILIGELNKRKDVATTQNEMLALLRKIGNLINACDRDIASSRWLPQWKSDLNRAMASVSGSGKEKAMADAINNALSRKYYWRDWLVVVYKEMVGHHVHWRGVCSVNHYSIDHLHWKKTYNVIVSSVDKKKREIHQSLRSVKSYESKRVRGPRNTWRTTYTYYNAQQIYNNLPAPVKSCGYMIRGVVKKNGNFEIRAPSRRKNYAEVTNLKQICTGRGRRKCRGEKFHVFALG